MALVHVDDYVTGISSDTFIPLERLGKVMTDTARKYGLRLECTVEPVKMDGMGFFALFKKSQDSLWLTYPKEGMSRICIIEEENAGSYYLNLYVPPNSAEIKMAQKQNMDRNGGVLGGMMAGVGVGKLKRQMQENEQYIKKMTDVIFPEAFNSPELFAVDIDTPSMDNPIPGQYVDETPTYAPDPYDPPPATYPGTIPQPVVPPVQPNPGPVYVDDPEPIYLDTDSEPVNVPELQPVVPAPVTPPTSVMPTPEPSQPQKKPAKLDLTRTQLLILTREEALNGCRKEIVVEGKAVMVDIPAKTTADSVVTVPGLGYLDTSTGERGVLNIQFFID